MPFLPHGRGGRTAAVLVLAALLAPAPAELAAALPPPSCAITLRQTPFAGGNDGAEPAEKLIQGDGRSLYGTTAGTGGADTDFGRQNSTAGTIFRFSPDGKLTTLHAFTQHDKYGDYFSHPNSGLAYARGAFYGLTVGVSVTFAGAPEDNLETPDTLFRITPAGALTTLESFPRGDDREPRDLVTGPGGVLYGTTTHTVFELTRQNHFITLHTFTTGSGPAGPLLPGRGGVLYGTTFGPGGAGGNGTVFRLTPDGVFTTLHVFTGNSDGPEGALAQDARGNLYSEAQGQIDDLGQEHSLGRIYKLTPEGALTTLYSFSSVTHIADGYDPVGGLTLGRDGNLYGVTEFGGLPNNSASFGTIFRLTPAGVLTTLHTFITGGDGGNLPLDGLTLGRDGQFYGTASRGGTHGGTVFRFTPPPAGCVNPRQQAQPPAA